MLIALQIIAGIALTAKIAKFIYTIITDERY